MKKRTLHDIMCLLLGITSKKLNKLHDAQSDFIGLHDKDSPFLEFNKLECKILSHLKYACENKNFWNDNDVVNKYQWLHYGMKTTMPLIQIFKVIRTNIPKDCNEQHILTNEDLITIRNNIELFTYSLEYHFDIWAVTLKEYERKVYSRNNAKKISVIGNYIYQLNPKWASKHNLCARTVTSKKRDKREQGEILDEFLYHYPHLMDFPIG